MHKFLLVFLMLFHCYLGDAQIYDDTTRIDTVEYDNTIVADDEDNVQEPEIEDWEALNGYEMIPDSVASWKKQKEFNYMNSLDSLLRKKQREAQPKKAPNLSFFAKLFTGGWVEMFLWVVALVVLGYVIFKIVEINGFFTKTKRIKQVAEEVLTEDERFLQADFDQEINKAELAQNYRDAVRFRFLKQLKLLNNLGILHFGIDKTNSQYLKEINSEMKASFAKVAHHYEYVWYGKIEPSLAQYEAIKDDFKKLNV